jgi:hypothetical protein
MTLLQLRLAVTFLALVAAEVIVACLRPAARVSRDLDRVAGHKEWN